MTTGDEPRAVRVDVATIHPHVLRRHTRGALLAVALLAALGAAFDPPRDAEQPAPHSAQLRLNPNTATRDELMLLPEIGPALADAIIAHRSAAAPQPAFSCAEDLDRVPRIGPKTIETLRPLLRFDTSAETLP